MLYHCQFKKQHIYNVVFLCATLCAHWLINGAEKEKQVLAPMPEAQQLSAQDRVKVATAIGYNFDSRQCDQKKDLKSIDPRYLMYPLNKYDETGLYLLVYGYLLGKYCRGIDQESENEVLKIITQILEQFPEALNIKNPLNGATLCHLAASYGISKDGFIQHELLDLLNKTGKARWDMCDITKRNCLMKLMNNTQEKIKFNPEQPEQDQALIQSMVEAKCNLEDKDPSGCTVLYELLRKGGSGEVIRFLVELKADPHTLNTMTRPRSTVDLARYHRSKEEDLIKFLENAGKPN